MERCGNCAYYVARLPELMTRCTRSGVCIKTADAVDPDWQVSLAPCSVYCDLSAHRKPVYWKPAGEVSDALQRWAGTSDGHVVLSAAERYAWGRNTGGSKMTLDAIAKLIPYAGENTATAIMRDIEGPYGTYKQDLMEMSKEQRGLFIACKERLGEADGLR